MTCQSQDFRLRSLSRWCGRTGERQHVEFTVNPFLDVYMGHVNTLKHILDRKEEAYHMLMQNILHVSKVCRCSFRQILDC